MITWEDLAEALTEAAAIEGREYTEPQVDVWYAMLTSRLPDDTTQADLFDAVRGFYTDPDHRGRLYPRDIIRHVEQSRKTTLWDMTSGENERLAAERAAWEQAHGHTEDAPCLPICPPRDPSEMVSVAG